MEICTALRARLTVFARLDARRAELASIVRTTATDLEWDEHEYMTSTMLPMLAIEALKYAAEDAFFYGPLTGEGVLEGRTADMDDVTAWMDREGDRLGYVALQIIRSAIETTGTEMVTIRYALTAATIGIGTGMAAAM